MWPFTGLAAGRHLHRGKELEAAGDLEQAAYAYLAALKADPSHFEARVELVRTLVALGYPGDAIRVGEERRELTSQSLPACLHLGDAYLAMARYDQALTLFERCHQHSLDVWSRLVFTHLGRRDAATALAVLDRWVRVDAGRALDKELRKVVLRYQEFPGDLGPRELPAKARAYVLGGTALLGLAGDNGVDIPEYNPEAAPMAGPHAAVDPRRPGSKQNPLALDLPGVARCLDRLLALARAAGWQPNCVVAGDGLSAPLAHALGQVLDLQVLPARLVSYREAPLLVLATAIEAEQWPNARAPGSAGRACWGWCLAGTHALSDGGGWSADAVGAPAAVSLPWSRGDDPTEVGRALAAAVGELPPEPNRQEQLQWYLQQHRRCRFAGG